MEQVYLGLALLLYALVDKTVDAAVVGIAAETVGADGATAADVSA